MCGFVGIVNKSQLGIDTTVLKKMASVINHRGPDEEGMLEEGPLGFFHKRLSIIDLSTGHQPMTVEDCTIVFNGEIYNYIELKENLKRRGHQFSTTSDTEVILHMYLELGDKFVNLLNGMFAFIIFDRKKNQLFIARDHFGIKPLYWYHDEEKILFGSEIKALLAHPDIPAIVDTENLYEYLTFQFVMGEGTMFKNIFKVQPGHFMTLDLNILENQYGKILGT